jgi:hypothetical protein
MPPPVAVPKPDVPDVKSWLDAVAGNHPDLRKWEGGLAGGGQKSPPTAPASTAPAGFERQKTNIDQATDMFGEGNMVGAVLTVLAPTPSTAVSNYYAETINNWQREFVTNYGEVLRGMSENMQRITWEIDGMRPMFRNPPRAHSNLDAILEEKQKLGDDLLKEIGNRLRETNDPDERARLEDLYKQTQQWMRERDARVEAEKPRVRDLQQRMEKLGEVAKSLDKEFDQASRESMKMVRYANNALHHAKPESAQFAYQLKQFLLGARGRLDAALRGK